MIEYKIPQDLQVLSLKAQTAALIPTLLDGQIVSWPQRYDVAVLALWC